MKNFVLIHAEKAIDLADISALERSVGFELPRAFVDLYLNFNGGEPSKSWVVTDDEYEPMQIADFKPIYTEGAGSPLDTRFVEGCYKAMCERQVIPHTLLPFAVDDGGNFYCLDMVNGSVLFYAVDSFQPELSMLANQIAVQRMLAKSFEQFVAELEEEAGF